MMRGESNLGGCPVNALIEELTRRKVFRVLTGYVVMGWLLVEVTATLAEIFETAPWLAQSITIVIFLGFPVAGVLAWFFDLTPDGLRRAEDVDLMDTRDNAPLRMAEHAFVVVLVLALGFVIWDAYFRNADTDIAGIPDAIPAPVGQSIAVLPFVNMSEDKDYFADGLSEELLNLLARVPSLKVAGRTSSFAFKGKNDDLRKIGAALDVAHVLEGSVRKSGSKLRITAQLIKVEDGFHLWSETYDREMTDVFEMQDDIAAKILSALKVHLQGPTPTRGLPTSNMEAYALYLEAKPLTASYQGIGEAYKKLQQAMALDPEFAEAYEMLAGVVSSMPAFGVMSGKEAAQTRLALATKALALDPSLDWSRTMVTLSAPGDRTFVDRRAVLEALLALQPHNNRAWDWLSSDLIRLGYFEAALEAQNKLLAIDPLYLDIYVERGHTYYGMGRYEEAAADYMYWGDGIGMHFILNMLALRALDQGDEDAAVALVTRYAEKTGVPAEMTLDVLRQLLDPATREAVMAREDWQNFFGPDDPFGQARARLYVLLGDDRFWPIFEQLQATGNAQTVAVNVMAFHSEHAFLEDPRFHGFARDLAWPVYWDKYGPPDICKPPQTSSICDLKPVDAAD